MISKRFLWADLIRVLAIYLVILTHSISSTASPYSQHFYLVISIICVPLLVLLSGSLLLSKNESSKDFYFKRVKKIIIPWIFWTMIYILWKMFFFKQAVDSLYDFLKLSYVTFFSQFWIIPMLCALYIVTPLIRWILKKIAQRSVFLFLILWFFIVSIYPFFAQKQLFQLPYFLQFSGYFILGYFLSKRTSWSFLPFTISIFVIGLSIGLLLPTNYWIAHLSPLVFLYSTAFFIVLKQFCIYFDNTISLSLRKKVTKLGSASFGIYFIHLIILDLFTWFHIFPIQVFYIGIFLQSILTFFLSYSIVKILQKFPGANLLIPTGTH